MTDELVSQSELAKKVEFSEVQKAFHTFAHDYEIVGHPDTPVNTPFNPPNGPDEHGHRQYNLTLLPEDMSEQQFLTELHSESGVVVFYGCMDRDAAMPAYKKLQEQFPGKKIVYITVAGGVVQKEDERKQSLTTISRYIAQHQENVEAVIATDHDHTCGKVKKDLGGIPLTQKLGIDGPLVGQHAPHAEQAEMKQLIRSGVSELKLPNLFGAKLRPALVAINRTGEASLDYSFHGVAPKSINFIAGAGK